MVIEVGDLTMGIPSSIGRGAPIGHAMWESTASGWNLRKTAATPGAISASAPKAAGQVVGQIRAIPYVDAPLSSNQQISFNQQAMRAEELG